MTRRPKCVCRSCSGVLVQALAPEHVVPGGLPTEAAIAQVIVSKFGDPVPFIDKPRFMLDKRIRIDLATLGNWSGQPVGDHIRHQLVKTDRLFMDETTASVFDPGCGATKKGYFWAILSDDRGHGVQVRRSCYSDMPSAAAASSPSSSSTASTDASCKATPMCAFRKTGQQFEAGSEHVQQLAHRLGGCIARWIGHLGCGRLP